MSWYYDPELSENELTEILRNDCEALIAAELEEELYVRFYAYEGDAYFFAEVARRRELREKQQGVELAEGAR